MSLLRSEILRIKQELGYPVVGINGAPYIEYTSIFDTVITQYLESVAQTTSTTYVAASGAPALVTIILADPAGFEEGQLIWVDVDERQERATLTQLVGTSATLSLSLEHGKQSTPIKYSVTVDSGEAVVREILADIAAIKKAMSLAGNRSGQAVLLSSGGGLKQIDEISLYQGNWANSLGGTMFVNLNVQLRDKRKQLASALGVPNLWEMKRGASFSTSPY